MKNYTKLLSSVGLTSLMLATATQAWAAEKVLTEEEKSANDFKVEVITVTSQKRIQTLAEVPLAVSAVTGGALDDQRISNMADLPRMMTSLDYTQGGASGSTAMRVRGVGTSAYGIGIESSVSIVVDGVVLSRQNEMFGELFDLERVEVLRGPQGTLFGKNATAGLVHFITKDATEDFTASGDAFYGSDNEITVRGSVSGELSDSGNVRGRLTGFYKSIDGHMNNLYDGEQLNGIKHDFGLRAKLAIDITDDLDLVVIADYSDREVNCCTQAWRTMEPDTNVFGIPFFNVNEDLEEYGITASDTNLDVALNSKTLESTENQGISANFTYDLGWASITSITSYRSWETFSEMDADISSHSVFTTNGGGQSQDTFTSELRITSTDDSALDYIAGLFYYKNDTERDFERLVMEGAGGTHDFFATFDTENIAVFGELGYTFDTGTRIFSGARYLSEDLDYTYVGTKPVETDPETGVKGPYLSADFPEIPTSFSDTATKIKLGISHPIHDRLNTYLTYSEGYKGQAVDLTSGFNSSAALRQPVAPESVESIEFGLKGTFIEDRLSVNIALFTSEFQDYQSLAQDPVNFGFNVTTAGDLETKGFEIETVFLATEDLELTFNATYQKAQITKNDGGQCYPGQTYELGCDLSDGKGGFIQEMEGAELANAPELKYFLAANQHIELSAEYTAVINASYSWQDEVQYATDRNPLTVHESYGLANLSGTIMDTEGLSLSLYINNLFDTSYASRLVAGGGAFGGSTSIGHMIPKGAERTFGIRVSYSYE